MLYASVTGAIAQWGGMTITIQPMRSRADLSESVTRDSTTPK